MNSQVGQVAVAAVELMFCRTLTFSAGLRGEIADKDKGDLLFSRSVTSSKVSFFVMVTEWQTQLE